MRNFSSAKIFASLFMGLNFRITVHGCSNFRTHVRNFRNTIHGCEIFAPCVLFSNFVPLTSDDHNFFVRTPFEVFLDSMESSLSQESRFMPVENK